MRQQVPLQIGSQPAHGRCPRPRRIRRPPRNLLGRSLRILGVPQVPADRARIHPGLGQLSGHQIGAQRQKDTGHRESTRGQTPGDQAIDVAAGSRRQHDQPVARRHHGAIRDRRLAPRRFVRGLPVRRRQAQPRTDVGIRVGLQQPQAPSQGVPIWLIPDVQFQDPHAEQCSGPLDELLRRDRPGRDQHVPLVVQVHASRPQGREPAAASL